MWYVWDPLGSMKHLNLAVCQRPIWWCLWLFCRCHKVFVGFSVVHSRHPQHSRYQTCANITTGHMLWQFISIFQICKKIYMLHKSIARFSYANLFLQKLQPFAYSGYVPGCLPAKDRYAQWSYCSTFGQNMIILHIWMCQQICTTCKLSCKFEIC